MTRFGKALIAPVDGLNNGFAVRPWQIALLMVAVVPLAVLALNPPAETEQNCPGARQPTLGPLNPQGEPWERGENDGGLGYCDTPVITGQKWRVHDVTRPAPRVVTPGAQSSQDRPGQPPSDAIVLLDGRQATYLEHWIRSPRPAGRGGAPAAAPQETTPGWKFEDGYITAVTDSGGITSKDVFSGPLQIHVEWAANPMVISKGQFRSNSGILIMGRYEIQVLDSYGNDTYVDGTAGSIYGQWPPLVNASRKPGEWQTYDIIWEPPDFEHLSPAYVTLIHNGLVVQNHQALLGPPAHRRVPTYTPHGPEGPISLQNHGERVNPLYRYIWVRELTGYDEQ